MMAQIFDYIQCANLRKHGYNAVFQTAGLLADRSHSTRTQVSKTPDRTSVSLSSGWSEA